MKLTINLNAACITCVSTTMGNTGSAHNLQNDCVENELSSYCSQEYLRRRTGERRKKYNQIAMGGWSNNRNVTDCKVLPKRSENIKLRATSNGAILQAGGTISFRAKEQADLERQKESETIYPMRRCHTLIIDSQKDAKSQRKPVPTSAEFRRSQTLLHVDYSRKKFGDNFLTNFESQRQNTSAAPTLKVNKYNKKRKAPPAPMKNSFKVDSPNGGQNLLTPDPISRTLTRPRMYAPNSNKPSITQKHLQSPTLKVAHFQRNSNTRTLENSSTIINQTNPLYLTKLPYRREKSFDVKLLRQKDTNKANDKIWLTKKQMEFPNCIDVNRLEDKLDRNLICDGESRKKLTQDNPAANKMSASFVNSCRSENNLGEKTTQSNSCKDNVKCSNVTEYPALKNESRTKYQQSRIPQLKRTFYFGMESSNKSSNINMTPNLIEGLRNENMTDNNEDIVLLNHKLEAEKEIVDNGILVHVRPTLPRRQPETPSFSPKVAWRNLVEEQQRLQLDRLKPIQNSRIIEAPICFTFSPKESCVTANASWTPQQDLDDDDDDSGNEEVKEVEQKCNITTLEANGDKEPENHTNSLHIYSLSLPRDVHLQYTEQENGLKAGNFWLVPGFNSLQNFKTNLGKNIDLRPNNKCACPPNTAFKRNSYQLQSIFADPFAVESKSSPQADCELNKASFVQKIIYKNDNWLLHKSNANDTSLPLAGKTLNHSSLKSPLNMISLANLQPKSLTNICGGKHIVYLPGHDACNASIKDSHKTPKQTKTIKSTHGRQRQKQEIVRQSLQDLTPIQNILQSNAANVTEKNTHRFSFQSTVRVLEKRRLAEKLSKDAEIHEAQRLNELEAMKRVEEDFQRKRAPEKAHLRNQLRLQLKTHAENGQYRSLPMNINKKDTHGQLEKSTQYISDLNNNIFCRPEPDGAVSPYLGFNDNLSKTRHSHFPLSNENSNELNYFEFGQEESESDTKLPDLQCTALLIEPYLHSII